MCSASGCIVCGIVYVCERIVHVCVGKIKSSTEQKIGASNLRRSMSNEKVGDRLPYMAGSCCKVILIWIQLRMTAELLATFQALNTWQNHRDAAVK